MYAVFGKLWTIAAQSNRSNEFFTRVDVRFKDIAIALPACPDGLSVTEPATDEARDLNID